MKIYPIFIPLLLLIFGCAKNEVNQEDKPGPFTLNQTLVDGKNSGFEYSNLGKRPIVTLRFSTKLDPSALDASVSLLDARGVSVPVASSLAGGDSTLRIEPIAPLPQLSGYTLTVANTLKSRAGGTLQIPVKLTLKTALDPSDKFPRISDDALLDLVQQQTFKYFWDFGHPVSGLTRERNSSGDLVTSGGSGFGIMTIPVAVERKFISRPQALERMQQIVTFLEKAETFHGAFPHWLNGNTGKAIAFSTKDNGADLVETSFLIQGLLTARQYFSQNTPAETKLREDINKIWHAVEWNWFQKGGENVLYWHWSPQYNWDMNHPITGWNESLITYVLAASSPTHPITAEAYQQGWTRNGAMANGKYFYDIKLPLGENNGGPLFFTHYSFLGLNPRGLKDRYADYFEQNKSHSLINRAYCIANPKGYGGYSADSWGLTASDIPNGYTASSPSNDRGVIAPTAALSSMPYTPEASMQALRHYYYQLGDKIWGNYGFHDAFSIQDLWFANSYLAIDQGPIIIMIENHRSGLLWKLFMSSPEIKTGLKKLDFTSPQI
ncbi:glucoamylase family protein [Dyadobacter tibetensis]|uniref:glucoamylase family protein n=1 Tax=Dyadobacter tibetensis TaxID=1211851 RepID=UPI0004AF330B|nr:glucoamylase family protein [Dyadobacter tibetensis]